MRIAKTLFLILVALCLCLARPVGAQTISLIPCWRPMVGIGVGPMVNGDRNGDTRENPVVGGGAARNVNASIDVPVGGEWAARIDGGTVSWAFEDRDFLGSLRLRDQIRLKRLSVGAMKSIIPPCDFPLRMYAGAGFGAYRYEYGEGGAVTRGGAHVFGGIDVLFNDHAAVGVAFSMHYIGGPDRKPIFSELFFAGQFSVGVKFGF